MNSIFKTLLILIIFFVNQQTQTHAQNIELQWGDEFKEGERVSFGSVIGEDEKHYFLLKTTKGGMNNKDIVGYLLETCSMDHKLVNSIRLDVFSPQGINGELDTIFDIGNRFVMFFSCYDSKQDMHVLYGVHIEKSGKQSVPVLIDQEPVKKEIFKGAYTFVLTEDKSKITVIRGPKLSKTKPEKLKSITLSTNFEVLNKKETELQYTGKVLIIDEYVVDQMGNVFILGGTAVDELTSRKDPKLFVFNSEIGKIVEHNLPAVPDRSLRLNGIKVLYNQSGLHIMSLYTHIKGMNKGNDGIFYVRLNSKNLTVEFEKLIEFDQVLLSKLTPSVKLLKGNGLDGHYRISDILIREGGRTLVIAENVNLNKATLNSFTQTAAYSTPNPTYYSGASNGQPSYNSTQYPHNSYQYSQGAEVISYQDLIVFQINQEGKIDWATRVPKNQESKGDDGMYSSYLFTYDQSTLYFLYNDHPKNAASQDSNTNPFEEAKKVSLNNPYKSIVRLAMVSNDGELSRMTIKNLTPEQKSVFLASHYCMMRNNRIWIVGAKGDIRKYGFLTLKNKG